MVGYEEGVSEFMLEILQLSVFLHAFDQSV